jgi:hypothetical protein
MRPSGEPTETLGRVNEDSGGKAVSLQALGAVAGCSIALPGALSARQATTVQLST